MRRLIVVTTFLALVFFAGASYAAGVQPCAVGQDYTVTENGGSPNVAAKSHCQNGTADDGSGRKCDASWKCKVTYCSAISGTNSCSDAKPFDVQSDVDAKKVSAAERPDLLLDSAIKAKQEDQSEFVSSLSKSDQDMLKVAFETEQTRVNSAIDQNTQAEKNLEQEIAALGGDCAGGTSAQVCKSADQIKTMTQELAETLERT